MRRLIAFTLLLVLEGQCFAQADEKIAREQEAFFEAKIRPVLVNSCYECHSKETGQNEGGLTLDTKVGLRQGGNSGPGVVPNDLEESWLWTAISHADPDYKMPPESKLPASVVGDFRTWIQMGAPDPRDDGIPAVVVSDINIEEGRAFWSFQQPRKSPPPTVSSEQWSSNAVDRFVRAKLDEKRMEPAGRAEPATLVRRMYFDLIGLPPSPDDISRFLAIWKSDSTRAIETTVDRLLASEHFGERWGRHWLDVARYAESNGKESNHSYPNAWRYRDYVIDSFNRDKPYDRFVKEQIAGDLLPARTNEQWQEGIIASAFLAIGPKPLREKSTRQFTMDVIDEQIDATTQALLGLTVACARCHDHKTDPIPTADYYSLAGILLSSNTHFGTFGTGGRFNSSALIELPVPGENREQLTEREIAGIRERLARLDEQLREHAAKKRAMMNQAAGEEAEGTPGKRSSAKRIRHEHNLLSARLASLDSDGVTKEYAMGMQDKDVMFDANILVRGEVGSPAQKVPRGFLQVLNHGPHDIANERSGRIELAQWLTSRQNPLTARVMVNRVWDKLFGRGLVSSTNNFGATGMTPSNPELLDYLAVQFMDDGWSVRSLIRSIVLTRAYQSSSEFNAANYARDPENEFLWRVAPRRLDAEALRDAILATSGQLELTRPSGSRVAGAGDVELGRRGSPDLMRDLPPYRSVYVPAVRNVNQEMLRLFDGADPDVVTGSRSATNVAGQALYLMNSPFIIEQADAFAKDLMNRFDSTKERLDFAFLRAYGRPATDAEMQSTLAFFRQFVPAAEEHTGDRNEAEWLFLTSVCQGLLCSAEFRFLN